MFTVITRSILSQTRNKLVNASRELVILATIYLHFLDERNKLAGNDGNKGKQSRN